MIYLHAQAVDSGVGIAAVVCPREQHAVDPLVYGCKFYRLVTYKFCTYKQGGHKEGMPCDIQLGPRLRQGYS